MNFFAARLAAAGALALAAPAPARADMKTLKPPMVEERAPAPPKPIQRRSPWGWAVVIPSVVAGGAITTYGFVRDCPAGDRSCTRTTSLLLASGVGVAAVGSMIGLAIVVGPFVVPSPSSTKRPGPRAPAVSLSLSLAPTLHAGRANGGVVGLGGAL